MKRILSILLTLLAFAVIFGNGSTELKACDRTSTQLDSVVFSGGLYTIYTTVCIGSGVKGINKGAGGDTRDIAFGFYTPGAVPITISGFTPATITGDTTGCPGFGFDLGPGPPPYNSQGTIGFLDLFACPNAYLCITSTALCGDLHSQCTQFSFTVDILPDSIRVFGAEGGGNPIAGCYPNPDMLIDFTVLPVVWGDLYGVIREEGVHLDWSTLSEINNDYFEIMRSADGSSFQSIGTLNARGASQDLVTYSYVDPNPLQGTSHYKVVQVDIDGSRSESEVIQLEYQTPEGLRWTSIGPVPAADYLDLSYASGEAADMNLGVYDVKGSKVLSRNVSTKVGNNTMHLDLDGLEAGIYYLQLKGQNGKLDYKMVKF